jgi:hypothetical protein
VGGRHISHGDDKYGASDAARGFVMEVVNDGLEEVYFPILYVLLEGGRRK